MQQAMQDSFSEYVLCFYYPHKRNLDRSVMQQLASCRWVQEYQNVVLVGPTGVGKTYLACALGNAACRKGFRVLYKRSSRFFDELRLAHASGSWSALLRRLAKIDVLIIDDWGHGDVDEDQRRDLNELLDDRHGERSTILTSQVPIDLWHDRIGNPNVADAICERILHKAHKLQLKGASRRKDTLNEK
jgi:DNA replication protein DnaC